MFFLPFNGIQDANFLEFVSKNFKFLIPVSKFAFLNLGLHELDGAFTRF